MTPEQIEQLVKLYETACGVSGAACGAPAVYAPETAYGVLAVKVPIRSFDDLMKMDVDHMKGVNIEDALVGIERGTNLRLGVRRVFFAMWKNGQKSLTAVFDSADPKLMLAPQRDKVTRLIREHTGEVRVWLKQNRLGEVWRISQLFSLEDSRAHAHPQTHLDSGAHTPEHYFGPLSPMSQGLPNLKNAFSTIAAPACNRDGPMLVRSVCGATLAEVFDHYKECTDDVDGLHRAWLEGKPLIHTRQARGTTAGRRRRS